MAVRHLTFGKYFVCLTLLLIAVRILYVCKNQPAVKITFLKNKNVESSAAMKLLTLPESFISARGAYCLDGSPPGYYYRPSKDKSVNSWIIFLPPGAWCSSKDGCYNRSKTSLGSSRIAPATLSRGGLLYNSCAKNSYFCYWNVLNFLYCDGSSFLGNVSGVVQYKSQSLYMRGAPIFDALVEYLLVVTHLGQAEHIVLAGSSAGGTAALINVDRLRSLLPKSVKTIYAVIDGSMFPDVPSISGHNITAELFKSVYNFHNLKSSLSALKCIQEQIPDNEWRCLLPEVYHHYVETPAFFCNSIFDTWQRSDILHIPCSIVVCPRKHIDAVNKMSNAIQQMAQQIMQSKKNSVVLTSRPVHGILITPMFSELKLGNSTVQSSLVAWLQKDYPEPQSYLASWLQKGARIFHNHLSSWTQKDVTQTN